MMKKLSKEQLARLGRECLSNNINRTARIITRVYDEKSRPHGYRATQVQTLYRIAYWEPVSISTLARNADMDRTTVIRNCKVLEKDGLITIKTGDDKRYRLIELTEKGWQIVNKSYLVWLEQKAEIEKKIGKEEIGKLLDLLQFAGKMLRE
jgi:DNA-binding MarR family transcriptional regulator